MKNLKVMNLLPGISIGLFFCIALYLRIALPFDLVFVRDLIKFTGADAYYHMRIIDNLVQNFPYLNSFDPYMLFPGGLSLGTSFLFFDYFVAAIILLVGMGSLSPALIDTVAVYVPAILGALTVIPVYFLGKELFNKWTGVIAASLIALSPGEFLGKSILGYTDHHVLEVILTSLTMLFLVLGIKSASNNDLNFIYRRTKWWPVIAKPLLYSVLAGLCLGLYLRTWLGALLFVFIIFLYFIIQFIIDHIKGKDTAYLSFVGVVTLAFAILIFAPSANVKEYIAALVGGLAGISVMGILSWFLKRKGLKAVYYPVILFVAGLAIIGIFYIIDANIVNLMISKFAIIMPSGTRLTTIEAQPLLFPDGIFSLELAWINFTTGVFLGIIALGIIAYRVVKNGEADKTLLVVWSLVILMAALTMRRFSYYYAVDVALLTGYAGWIILSYTGFKKASTEPVAVKQTAKIVKANQKKQRRHGHGTPPRRLIMGIGVVIVFFLLLFPNIGPAIETGKETAEHYAPLNAWVESLKWLKANSPEPMGNDGAYYQRYKEPFSYPDTAYGVTAWWDYGYLITRIGHRMPNCNPGGGYRETVAKCFTSQDESSAGNILSELKSRYVMVDNDNVTGVFYAIAQYSGTRQDRFYETYYEKQGTRLKGYTLFYPEYYRSFVVRLYSFNGSQVPGSGASAVTYEEKTDARGDRYKEIINVRSFPNYEAANSYVNSQGKTNCRVVGTDPYISPISLEKLVHVSLVYSSRDSIKVSSAGSIPTVKVFQVSD